VDDYSSLNQSDFVIGIMNDAQREHLISASKSPCFILCADATHGTNEYEIKLIRVLTIDSFGMGVPIALFYSNCEDEQALTILFKKIVEKCGSLRPKVSQHHTIESNLPMRSK
jgi:hypothetical protein